MLQFSLRTLLLSAILIAIGCAALVHPTEVWRQVIVTITVLALMLSTLVVIFRQGTVRIAAVGCAVMGWLYFLLAFTPVFAIRDHLLTTRSLDTLGMLTSAVSGSANRYPTFTSDRRQLVTGSSDSNIRLWNLTGNKRNFHDIGHALWTLIFGVIGSVVAGWLSRYPTPSS